MAKKNKKDDLDTETTFADMNVEGFSWYNPHIKKKRPGDTRRREKLTRKEKRELHRAMFSAYLPVFLIVIAVFAIMGLIGYIWTH